MKISAEVTIAAVDYSDTSTTVRVEVDGDRPDLARIDVSDWHMKASRAELDELISALTLIRDRLEDRA